MSSGASNSGKSARSRQSYTQELGDDGEAVTTNFCWRFKFDDDKQEEEERRERLPALAFKGKERMERWPAPS
jgi:hypothetical protein